MAAAIASVVHVVLNAPDQPATIRRQPSPAKASRRDRPAPAVPTVPVPATPAFALADSDIMRLRVLPATRTTHWVRIRSGVALVVLVAVLGALLALAIGGVGLGFALLIRSATA